MVIERLTTSRDARSLAFGAYRSMKRSPAELVRNPPSPRTPSVMRHPAPYTPVGWNCTNSMSWSGSPARSAIALPSPVHVCADVHEK